MKKRMWMIATVLAMAAVLSSCASSATINADEAKEIALAEAGVTADAVQGLTAHLEHDDGRTYYEVDFYVGAVEYDVEVDAKTGEIRKYDREGGELPTSTAASTTATTVAMPETATTTVTSAKAAVTVTEEEAKQTALTDAGFAGDVVERLTVKLDYDDGKARYDVEFFKDGTEYEYEIDADTGKIVDKDLDTAIPD